MFPARVLCPSCGASAWEGLQVDEGVVEEATAVERAPGGPLPIPVRLGSVRLPGGVLVVGRLGRGVEEGRSVRLEYRDGVPVAEAKEP